MCHRSTVRDVAGNGSPFSATFCWHLQVDRARRGSLHTLYQQLLLVLLQPSARPSRSRWSLSTRNVSSCSGWASVFPESILGHHSCPPSWADFEFVRCCNAADVDEQSKREIKEILLQQAIYCGVPAANHAVKEASAIVDELGLGKR